MNYTNNNRVLNRHRRGRPKYNLIQRLKARSGALLVGLVGLVGVAAALYYLL